MKESGTTAHGAIEPRAMPRAAAVDRAAAIGLGALAVLVPLVFHRAFFSNQALVYLADSAQLQFARYRILCDALQVHRAFPLWQDLVYAGSPFHASPENPTLYPPALALAAFGSPVTVMNGLLLSGLALAALGAYLFVLRLWGRVAPPAWRASPVLGPVAAFVAACGFSMAHYTRLDGVNLVAYGHAHAWIPWMLWAAEGVIASPRPRRQAGLLALFVAAEFHTGGLYVWPYAFLLLALWFVAHGLLGGREARRRTLVWGGAAAACAALMLLAKLVPYAEWVGTTNRSGALPLAEARGVTIGSEGGGPFTWSGVWPSVRVYAAGGWPLVLALGSLPLLRAARARTLWLLAALFFAVACGGVAYRVLYEVVPPFDRVRNAVRAWMMVNALLPVLAGLGAAWLVGALRAVRERRALVLALGVAVGLALAWRSYSSSPRHDGAVHNPDRYEELVGRYVVWPEAAARAGTDQRAFWIDKTVPDGRNEQFITAALRVETVAGYLGHVWPGRLERHVYFDTAGAPLASAVRHRRLAVLSTRWFVTLDPSVPPSVPPERFEPVGVDGSTVFENELARPRAFAPAAVIGVIGGEAVIRALLDDARFPLRDASALALDADGGKAWSDAELRALDAVVVADGAAPSALVERASGLGVERVGFPSGAERLFELVVERVRSRATLPFGFERTAPGDTTVAPAASSEPDGPRWVVVSEPWSWYAGWRVHDAAGNAVAPRRADGIASALLTVPDAGGMRARYAPLTFPIGLVLGALGLMAALWLALPGRA